MVLSQPERVLLIGDTDNTVAAALAQAAPSAIVDISATLFDGIAQLSGGRYSTVLAAAEPIERRPEAAVKVLRQAAADARLLLFGHPTLEILSKKMLQFGVDDYLITPANPRELEQVFSAPRMRLARTGHDVPSGQEPTAATPSLSAISGIGISDLLINALLQSPQDAMAAAIREINARIGPALQVSYSSAAAAAPAPPAGSMVLSNPVHVGVEQFGMIHLTMPNTEDEAAARHTLAHLAASLGKLAVLQERHNQLQKLAITDELTGLYNARYFRHFLSLIIDRARRMRFPVTLLLFDIDDFKKYNDQFGHNIGDEILRQAATLMRRCTRQHDLVARIGGDEFAVVFWDKEGPRQPRDPRPGVSSRLPQEPLQIFERFRGLISSEEFPLLGQTGKGVLTVSAGLAVFPYEASNADDLVNEADRALMQGAKRNGKNSIYIVGTDDPTGEHEHHRHPPL